MNKNDVQSVSVTGSQATQVALLLNWSSSDESVVTVSSAGVIIAVGYGKATVSATDGNKSSTCEVVVMQNATTVNLQNQEMFIGQRKVIAPVFTPSTATETAMVYTYDQGNVIKIDEYGVIQALAAGTVTVTGTTDYGVSSNFIVTVIDPDFIRQKGDVNGDDKVNVIDLVRLKKHIAGAITLVGDDLSGADLSKDGNITATDIVILRKILLGII